MRVGLKLETGFAADPNYRGLYTDRDILPYLQERGVAAVETPIGLDTEAQLLNEHLHRCSEAGMIVSLHPYTERTDCNPMNFAGTTTNPCLQLHRRFFEAAAVVADLQQFETVVNIHPAAGPAQRSRREMIERSVRFFDWAREWCSDNAPAVRVVAELQVAPNPDEPIQRIGDNYDELLEIVERSGVSTCWDFGHAVMNHRRFDTPLNPPESFVDKVAHVHCHDVDSGEDHKPLLFGAVPWRDFLQRLQAKGFSNTVILEVPPDRFLGAGGLPSLIQSLDALQQIFRDD